jgi:hypothetical protein
MLQNGGMDGSDPPPLGGEPTVEPLTAVDLQPFDKIAGE